MTEDTFKTNQDLKENSLIDSNPIKFDELFNRIFRRKKVFILITSILVSTSFGNLIYKRIVNPVYRGAFTIMISDPIIDKNRNLSSGSIESLAMNRESSDIPTLIQYLKSTQVLQKIAEKNNLTPLALSNRIFISVPGNSGNLVNYLPRTLQVALEGSNKNEMRIILEDLSKIYLKIAFERKSKNLLDGITFLENERPKLLLKSKKIQSELEEFRLENKIISPIKEGDILTSNIEEIKDKILSLESENIRLLFIKKNLESGILFTQGINNFGTSVSGLGIIGSDQLLLKEILDVKAELANAQSKYKKSSSIVKSLNAKLEQLEPILLKNQQSAVEAAIVLNKSLIKSSRNKLSELNKTFESIPGKINKFSIIMQNKRIIDENLASLISAKEKLQLELSQGTLPWNIIVDPFINPKPFKPNVRKNFIYILLGSLTFSSLITLLIDRLDNVFHNPTEIEKVLKLPTLGFVPFFNLKKDLKNKNLEKVGLTIKDFLNIENKKLLNNIDFIFQETFRNIYTSIKFSISDKEIKTICFTSTIPQEGKSLCSLFLAMNVSEISKKILIIDTDLRRPALHKQLNVDNVSGVSNYLVNIETKWQDFVQKHESFKNLSYITAGKIPPNAVRLLNSKRMKNMVDELRDCKDYDLVIFDCPPVLGLADSLIIADLVDGIVLTVSLNKVDRSLAQETLRKLESTTKPLIGTIANAVNKPYNFDSNPDKYSYYGDYRYQYKYNTYKYMPEETKNRYTNSEIEFNDNKKENFKKFMNLKSSEKVIFLYKNFINWLNE